MCGRFTVTNPERVLKRFELTSRRPSKPSFNIAPSLEVIAVTEWGELHPLKWGLIPSWAKEANIGNKLANARAETVEEKPSFRNAFKKRRCLVLADGFYEWKKAESGSGPKRPFYFYLKDHEAFAFAGLWEIWKDPKTEKEIETCALITTEANTVLRPVHDRMPVILPTPEAAKAWLKNPDKNLLQPLAPGLMQAHEVSTLVNKPANNSSENIAAVKT